MTEVWPDLDLSLGKDFPVKSHWMRWIQDSQGWGLDQHRTASFRSSAMKGQWLSDTLTMPAVSLGVPPKAQGIDTVSPATWNTGRASFPSCVTTGLQTWWLVFLEIAPKSSHAQSLQEQLGHSGALYPLLTDKGNLSHPHALTEKVSS